MPSVRYYNQTAPFWDFVANLEEQGSTHPFFNNNNNQRSTDAADGENNDNNDNTRQGQNPWTDGWTGFPFGPMPHRGRHGHGPPHHRRGQFGQQHMETEDHDMTAPADGAQDPEEGPSEPTGPPPPFSEKPDHGPSHRGWKGRHGGPHARGGDMSGDESGHGRHYGRRGHGMHARGENMSGDESGHGGPGGRRHGRGGHGGMHARGGDMSGDESGHGGPGGCHHGRRGMHARGGNMSGDESGHGGPGRHHAPHGPHARGMSDDESAHGGPGRHHGPRAHGGPGIHKGRGGGRRGGRGRGGPFGQHGFGPMGGFGGLGALAAMFQDQLFGENAANNNNTEGVTKDNSDDFTPEADVFDTADSFVVHVSLPGAKKEDVGVNWDAEKSELNIAGVTYRPGDEKLLESLALDERKVGAFERKVRLGSRASPAQIDVDGISARMEDGILRVDVPKLDSEYVEIRKVDIE